ncbi:MAG: hypothetical protein FWC15_05150 [Fibromonadales bacterium]|nr:hypothetical protein [Fibromonadales bacterium]
MDYFRRGNRDGTFVKNPCRIASFMGYSVSFCSMMNCSVCHDYHGADFCRSFGIDRGSK